VFRKIQLQIISTTLAGFGLLLLGTSFSSASKAQDSNNRKALFEKRCGGCHAVWYCGKDHQPEDWQAGHKKMCKTFKRADEEGFVKEVTTEGTGPQVRVGEQATVHYVGELTNGTVFDSSRKKERPFKFDVGAQRVIKAWDEGVATMRVGERARLICSPEYAYGAAGAGGVIPGGAFLIFDVEVLATGPSGS